MGGGGQINDAIFKALQTRLIISLLSEAFYRTEEFMAHNWDSFFMTGWQLKIEGFFGMNVNLGF